MPRVKKLVLPKSTDEGVPYVSYSQIKTWKEMKGFNTGLLGRYEYIRKYLFGEKYPDKGWGEFGNNVEDALETRNFDKFTKAEIKTLDQIKVLDVWQHEFYLPIPGTNAMLFGKIDNANKEFNHIRDYKTASENSKEQYYTDDYVQLDIYAEGVKHETGEYPSKMDVVIVQRNGNPFRGDKLTVGSKIWNVQKEVSQERINAIMADVKKYTIEIAECYAVYKKLVGDV